MAEGESAVAFTRPGFGTSDFDWDSRLEKWHREHGRRDLLVWAEPASLGRELNDVVRELTTLTSQ